MALYLKFTLYLTYCIGDLRLCRLILKTLTFRLFPVHEIRHALQMAGRRIYAQ